MSLEPDNLYNEVAVSFGWFGLPWNTTLTASAALGQGSQDSSFVGYTLNPGLEISLVQEIGIFIYGSADGAPSTATSTPRFNSTRLTLRYALGQ
mgnify:CR=1 FL=1